MSGIHAVRVAAMLKRDLDVDVEMVDGHYGEFTVLVDGEEVVIGGAFGFLGVLPSLSAIRDRVRSKLSHEKDNGRSI